MNNEADTAESFFNPFPGLRPFNLDESHLFFGREGQSQSVLQSLKANNFVAVIGASGSGKSSLIYCGVIPDLLSQRGKIWKAISTRPGSSPLTNLYDSLKSNFGEQVNPEEFEKVVSGETSFRDWLDRFIPPEESLLLVIDQFEEIFRYQNTEHSDTGISSVERYVEIIHGACTRKDRAVHIVLTMRSDFIGECAVFQNLTDLINRSNYLVPQMTRSDFRRAIEGPISIGNASINPNLVEQLLDELGNNTDQLPVLQHALMRTWDYWAMQNDREKPISIGDYEAVGRMEKALSDHANEAFDELKEEQRGICESLFKTITEKGGDNRGVRRPSKISQIAGITKCEPQEIIEVAEVFRSKGRTFLTPYQPVELTPETVIDISHESLMRIWDRLRLWVDEEAGSVQMYLKLSEASELFQAGTGGLWRPPDLQLALNWRDTQKPTAKWAVQYDPAFERAMVYLDTSEAEFRKQEENKIRLQRRRLRVTRIFSLVLGGIAVIAMGLFLWTRDLQIEAEEQTKLAVESEQTATMERLAADSARVEADSARIEAESARVEAEVARDEALDSEQAAQAARELALQRENEAQKEREAAEAARLEALQQEMEATKAKEQAEENAQLAEQRRMLSIAQSMAVKSAQMRTDTLLKGLLAYQAYAFNDNYEGITYDPDIFSAIYSGLKFFKGADYNILKGHSSSVGTIINYDDQIVSASSEGKIISWDTRNASFNVLMSDLPSVRKLFAGNPSLMCLTNHSIVKINAESEQHDVYELPLYSVNDIVYTNEGRYLLVKNNQLIIAEDYKSEGEVFYETDRKINVLEYNGESGFLIAGLSDGEIVYWDNFHQGSEDPEFLTEIPDANWSTLKLFPAQNMLAAGTGNSQGAVYLYDLESGKQLNSLRGHNARITDIVFSNNGQLMATSSYDGSVNLWHLNDLNTLPVKFDDHGTWVTSLVFTSDDKYVISGDREGFLRKLPTEVNTMMNGYCKYISRVLSESEWQNYIGQDIEYKPSQCNE